MSNPNGICDVEECGELARFVETGDGEKLQNPRERCRKHFFDGNVLWRDRKKAFKRKVVRDQ